MSAVLDRLIRLEQYEQYLRTLTPGQLCVLHLRELGLNFYQVGDILHITHQAAALRLHAAGERLLQTHPELRPLAQARGTRSYNRQPRRALTDREQLVLDTLAHLDGHGNGSDCTGATTTELARLLNIPPDTLSRVTRGLVARGLLRRGQRTGRGVPLYLSEKAKP